MAIFKASLAIFLLFIKTSWSAPAACLEEENCECECGDVVGVSGVIDNNDWGIVGGGGCCGDELNDGYSGFNGFREGYGGPGGPGGYGGYGEGYGGSCIYRRNGGYGGYEGGYGGPGGYGGYGGGYGGYGGGYGGNGKYSGGYGGYGGGYGGNGRYGGYGRSSEGSYGSQYDDSIYCAENNREHNRYDQGYDSYGARNDQGYSADLAAQSNAGSADSLESAGYDYRKNVDSALNDNYGKYDNLDWTDNKFKKNKDCFKQWEDCTETCSTKVYTSGVDSCKEDVWASEANQDADCNVYKNLNSYEDQGVAQNNFYNGQERICQEAQAVSSSVDEYEENEEYESGEFGEVEDSSVYNSQCGQICDAATTGEYFESY